MSEAQSDSKRRLFFALWPADELRRQIEEATVGPARHSGGHVVPARNFHVTLAFIGDVLPPQVDEVITAGAATSAPRFSMAFDQVEDRLFFTLLEKQIKLKREVYRPHVTLVRNLPSLRPLQKIEQIGWPVQEFALIESAPAADESRSDESRYTVLARWPLA